MTRPPIYSLSLIYIHFLILLLTVFAGRRRKKKGFWREEKAKKSNEMRTIAGNSLGIDVTLDVGKEKERSKKVVS